MSAIPLPVRQGALAIAFMWSLLKALGGCAATEPSQPATPPPANRLAAVRSFACCYRADLTPHELDGFEMAIVAAEVERPPLVLRAGSGRPVLGYLSIGEAESERRDWQQVQGKTFIVEENPDWPGSFRVDPRASDWQALVLARAERIWLRGFDGFFLDTADVAEYLERKDERFRGAVDAMAGIVRALKEAYPEALIVLNQGLALYPAVGKAVDGAMAEGLFARYDFAAKGYGPAPTDRWHRERLNRFEALRRGGVPVFSVEYAPADRRDLIAEAIGRCWERGFVPYVATVDLQAVRRETLEHLP